MQVSDVIVVGAGPAGSALSRRLARDGYSVLLLEKERFPRDKVCGDLVSGRALRLLDDIGCYPENALRTYAPIRESAVYLEGKLIARGRLPSIPGNASYGHAVPRAELDTLIFRKAVEAGAEPVERCTVKAVSWEPSLVAVEAEVDGARRRYLGRTIVGADGAASTVARSAGLEMRDPRYVQLAMRSYCHGLRLDHAVLYFSEEFFPGYGWIFPVDEAVCNVGVGMVKESARKDGIALRRFYSRLTEFVKGMAAEAGVEVELTPASGWPIKTYGGATRNYFERGLLIGDAGCFVDPLSGEGIPLALETADMAAATIRDAFGCNALGLAGMSAFEGRWRDHYAVDLGVSDLIVAAIRNRRFAKLWIHWLRVIAMTAAEDEDYSLKVGGILAGLVPNREAYAPDVVARSILHGPAFWLRSLGIPGSAPADILVRGADLLAWEADLVGSAMADFDWFSRWALEVGSKQLKVLDTLLGARERGAASESAWRAR